MSKLIALPKKLQPTRDKQVGGLKLVYSVDRKMLSSYELQCIQLRANALAATQVLEQILKKYDTGSPLQNQKAVIPRRNETE